ncbi:LysR family transcriptional regulator [Polymorphobacter multimanifer]|uniref:DNA-binding transcriptional LysR family regulator n=1 Tax=Polymorphobacter multimanifer TaxID=1070431 RepID=A0A841L796_9SPHN|nr:LysR family transcriptional regulator [Polymorphobacter multimanifer]MBB6228859.1 DNA-binding transcriptional LysR family regulator [Polymorphobacter multimanifer]GGI73178.1 LysR family transcriptional regulator [Polymorphobacter multimanifer]
MDLRHLRYFLAVVEEAHVGRAARRLHVSQPALSQQLRDLEHAAGGPLFTRHAKGMTLTAAGEALVGPARIAVASAATALAEVRLASGQAEDRLVVGLPETGTAFELVRLALGELDARFSPSVVQTSGLPWLHQPQAVLRGSLDVGFCWSAGLGKPADGAYPPGMASIRLCDDPGSDALIPWDHPLAEREQLGPEDLRDLPLGLYDRTLHPSLHDVITSAARQAGFHRVMLAEGVGSASASAPLVLARTGWTLVQKSVALQPPAGTRAIPVKNLRVDAGLDLIFREGDNRKSVVGLVDGVRRTFAQVQ